MQDNIVTLKESSNELREMQHQIQFLLTQARTNESTLKKFREIELAVIAAGTLPELISVIVHHIDTLFGVDQLCLTLFDEGQGVEQLLANSERLGVLAQVALLPEAQMNGQKLFGTEPWVGPFQVGRHKQFFKAHSLQLKSTAIVPLARPSKILGYLSFASEQAGRFSRMLATDFLKQLGATIAVCLENTLRRHYLETLESRSGTRLHSQAVLRRRLLEEISRAQRSNSPLSCLVIDIDRIANAQRNGVRIDADAASEALVRLLLEQMRCSDIIAQHEEQAVGVLLPSTDSQTATRIAERIQRLVEDSPIGFDHAYLVPTTVSVGVSTLQSSRNRAHLVERGDRLLHAADQALLRARGQGGNRVACYGLC